MEMVPLSLAPVPPVGASAVQTIAALAPKTEALGDGTAPVARFQGFLADAIAKTNDLSAEADDAVAKLVTGQDVDLHNVMIAMEKASLSLQLTMQVRNKIVDAYQQIMQMQI